MAKVSPNNITSLSQDWNRDPANGYPFSGAAVQSFIKSYLGSMAKSSWFDANTMTLYWFASDDDKDAFVNNTALTNLVLFSTTLSFASELFRIALTNNVGSTTINIATNVTEVLLPIGFEVQKKSLTDAVWTTTNSGVYVSTYADPGAAGIYDLVQENKHYNAGETFSIDVRQYLVAGANRVRVTFVDEDDSSVTATILFTINMTEMFIEPLNNRWYIPVVEGGDSSNYQLGGFRIIGSLNKMLHVDVFSNDSKVKEFSYSIGTSTYDQVPFYYTSALGFSLSTLETGVYLVSAYLTSGTGTDMITSAAINYNIMYIAHGDDATTQLVCINEVSDVVYNYTTSKMFEYAIYNKGSLTGSPAIVVRQITGTSPTVVIDTTLNDIQTLVAQTYEVPLEWLTEETLNLSVRADMTYGNEQTAIVPVDNSATFPPTRGFEFYMNCASRANSDLNYLKLVNAVNGTQYTPTWSGMTWRDGIDGWTTDDTGRKCLYLPAGTSVTLPYSDYRFINGDGITLEFCYRISNTSDYSEVAMSIADSLVSAGFRGIKIKPTNILVHSSEDVSAVNDLMRGTNVMDESLIHFVLTIYPNFKGNTGRNIVTGYINGCKNFQFDYSTGTLWATDGDLKIGCTKSDVSLYFIRVYRSVLSDANVQANYINSQQSIAARTELAELLSSVMDDNGTNISYESVKNSNRNFFVIEMLNGATLPSRANGWTKDTNLAARSNLEMHFGEHPAWDWKIENVETAGQGTTSMGYYRWNLRWRIDKSTNKKVNAYYLSARTERAGSYSYTWGEPANVGSINFDGVGNHPALKRMTAKINFASSMQSHKIGATLAYTELHDAIGLSNEAQDYADSHNMPMPAVAVYQYPVYGFLKEGNSYSFVGLFTIGPDKGDKPTFGYNIDDSIADELITMEGTDHDRTVVMFNHPWNEYMTYLASDECLNVTTGDKRGGWEVSNCHIYDTGKATDQASIQDALEDEFKPAYDLVFDNSTLIFGVALDEYGATAEATLTYINNNVSTFGGTLREGNRIANSNYQFWIEGEYDLYYLDARTGKYVAGINLITEYGTPSGSTIAENNEWFKAKRREAFMASAEDYWDIQDALFHYAFVIAIGAVDNFGKNTYPYKMATLAHGGRWKWRQDDLDSILGINNSGYDTVPVSAEYDDVSSPGAAIYGGSASVFWNLIKECYTEDYVSTITSSTTGGIKTMGKAILTAMSSIAGGANIFAGALSYFNNTFWKNAQKYFPQSTYNADAAFKYEAAWLAHDNQQAEPLPQSLGDHYSAEYYWVYNRIVYLMSLFRAGPFGVYNDANLGQISFRPVNLPSLTITPSMTMYPTLGDGTTMRNGTRTQVGNSYTFVGPFSQQGQTTMEINASNYITSLGDWKDLKVNTELTSSININGNKLQNFKIGDEDADIIVTPAVYYTEEEIANAEEGDDAYGKTADDIKTPAVTTPNVTTNVQGLSFNNVPCLETIEARNASSISGAVDISACKRLVSAQFAGTSATQITLADGQRIQYLSLPDTVTTVIMKNLVLLQEANLELPESLSGVQLVQIENCAIDALEFLQEAYSSDNSALRYFSIAFTGIRDISISDMHFVHNLATDKDKDGNDIVGGYHGVSANGAALVSAPPTVDGILRVTGNAYESDVNTVVDVTTIDDYDENYKIARIPALPPLSVIYNPLSLYIDFADSTVDSICALRFGDGTGTTKAQVAAVTSLSTYFKGTSIVSFDELKYFTGLTSIYGSSASSSGGAFQGCTSLENIILPTTVMSIDDRAFMGCTSLASLVLPSTVTTIGAQACYGCTAIQSITIEATTPPTWGSDWIGYDDELTTFFVPSSAMSSYMNATSWIYFRNRFKAIGSGGRWLFEYGNVSRNYYFVGYTPTQRSQGHDVSITDYIEVPPSCRTIMFRTGITGTLNINSGTRSCQLNFYDSSKNGIGYVLLSDNLDATEVSVPERTSYIRTTVRYLNSWLNWWLWDVTNDTCLWPYRTEEQ